MSFRGHVTRLLRTVRGSGTAAVEIGDFQPADTSGAYAASVVLWDALGGATAASWFCALAMQDSGIGGHPVAYLGIGQRGASWAPNLKLYNSGGIAVQSIGQSGIDFNDLTPGAARLSGYTHVGFDTITTAGLIGAGGQSLKLDGNGNPILAAGPLHFDTAPTLAQPTGKALSMPGGKIVGQKVTASSPGSTTGSQTVFDLGNVTFVAGRSYELRMDAQFQSTIAGDSVAAYLDLNGVTNIGVGQVYLPRAGSSYTLTKTAPYEPGAADVTAGVSVVIQRSNGTGTVSMFANTGEPANFSVHDVGSA